MEGETQEGRVKRSLNSLGFEIWRCGNGFKLTDNRANVLPDCKPEMTLDEIEAWIGDRVAGFGRSGPFAGAARAHRGNTDG